jgi:hypothetical protein
MEILNERNAQMKFARSYDKSNNWGKATVTECKTIYLVTIRIFGYSLPSVLNWKISKKEAANMLDAVMRIAQKAYKTGNL